MKTDKKKPKKSFALNNTNLQNEQSKFELVSCPLNGKSCKKHLTFINKNYTESDFYHQSKEYQKSIEALNNAFLKTFELKEDTCAKCAKAFRYAIFETLENIHLELQSFSNGLFKTNQYHSSYILADNILHSLAKKID